MGVDPITLGIMAAGTLLQAGGQVMGSMAAGKEAKARQSQEDMETQNQRLQQVRQTRIKRAQIVQAGANQGAGTSAGESSAVYGGAQGVDTQGAQNIQYIDTQHSINQAIFKAQGQEATAQNIQQVGKGITDLGGVGFSNDQFISKKTGIPVGSIFGTA